MKLKIGFALAFVSFVLTAIGGLTYNMVIVSYAIVAWVAAAKLYDDVRTDERGQELKRKKELIKRMREEEEAERAERAEKIDRWCKELWGD